MIEIRKGTSVEVAEKLSEAGSTVEEQRFSAVEEQRFSTVEERRFSAA